MNLGQLKEKCDALYFDDNVSLEDWYTLIEHTHTQTIQSVRERVEGYRSNTDSASAQIKNRLIDTLLKDLEAPVEGDGV